MSTIPSPSLEQVQQAFTDWRATGGSHRTPLELQRQAAQLLDHHTVGGICKALRLDHRRLKRWRAQLLLTAKESTSATFVELPPALSSAALLSCGGLALTLTRHAPDGSAVSISGQLEASHWRWALGLLRESGT